MKYISFICEKRSYSNYIILYYLTNNNIVYIRDELIISKNVQNTKNLNIIKFTEIGRDTYIFLCNDN